MKTRTVRFNKLPHLGSTKQVPSASLHPKGVLKAPPVVVVEPWTKESLDAEIKELKRQIAQEAILKKVSQWLNNLKDRVLDIKGYRSAGNLLVVLARTLISYIGKEQHIDASYIATVKELCDVAILLGNKNARSKWDNLARRNSFVAGIETRLLQYGSNVAEEKPTLAELPNFLVKKLEEFESQLKEADISVIASHLFYEIGAAIHRGEFLGDGRYGYFFADKMHVSQLNFRTYSCLIEARIFMQQAEFLNHVEAGKWLAANDPVMQAMQIELYKEKSSALPSIKRGK